MSLYENETGRRARNFMADMNILERFHKDIDRLEALCGTLKEAGVSCSECVCPHSHTGSINLWLTIHDKDDIVLRRLLEKVTAYADARGAKLTAKQSSTVDHGIAIEVPGEEPITLNLTEVADPAALMFLFSEGRL